MDGGTDFPGMAAGCPWKQEQRTEWRGDSPKQVRQGAKDGTEDKVCGDRQLFPSFGGQRWREKVTAGAEVSALENVLMTGVNCDTGARSRKSNGEHSAAV